MKHWDFWLFICSYCFTVSILDFEKQGSINVKQVSTQLVLRPFLNIHCQIRYPFYSKMILSVSLVLSSRFPRGKFCRAEQDRSQITSSGTLNREELVIVRWEIFFLHYILTLFTVPVSCVPVLSLYCILIQLLIPLCLLCPLPFFFFVSSSCRFDKFGWSAPLLQPNMRRHYRSMFRALLDWCSHIYCSHILSSSLMETHY